MADIWPIKTWLKKQPVKKKNNNNCNNKETLKGARKKVQLRRGFVIAQDRVHSI